MKRANECGACHTRRDPPPKSPSASDPGRKPRPTALGSPPRKIKVTRQTDPRGGPRARHLPKNPQRRPSAPLNHAATPTLPARCPEQGLIAHRLRPVRRRRRVLAPCSDSLPVPRQAARNWRGGRDRRQYQSQSAARKAVDFRPEGHWRAAPAEPRSAPGLPAGALLAPCDDPRGKAGTSKAWELREKAVGRWKETSLGHCAGARTLFKKKKPEGFVGKGVLWSSAMIFWEKKCGRA